MGLASLEEGGLPQGVPCGPCEQPSEQTWLRKLGVAQDQVLGLRGPRTPGTVAPNDWPRCPRPTSTAAPTPLAPGPTQSHGLGPGSLPSGQELGVPANGPPHTQVLPWVLPGGAAPPPALCCWGQSVASPQPWRGAFPEEPGGKRVPASPLCIKSWSLAWPSGGRNPRGWTGRATHWDMRAGPLGTRALRTEGESSLGSTWGSQERGAQTGTGARVHGPPRQVGGGGSPWGPLSSVWPRLRFC